MVCPAGTYAVSGGFASNAALDLGFNRPVGGSSTSPPTGWQVAWVGVPPTPNVRVYVVCSP